LLLQLFELISGVKTEVKCDSVGESFIGSEETKTCHMTNTTIIDSENVTITTRDKTILGLLFDENMKISFLPEKVDKSFPNLKFYSANGCDLQDIFRANFKGLKKLKGLSLNRNKIEMIQSDTFVDLKELEVLELGK
jgi:Leucine-rich repeat (LRR) protein